MLVASMGLVQEVGEPIGDGAHRVTHFPDPQEEEREQRHRHRENEIATTSSTTAQLPPQANI